MIRQILHSVMALTLAAGMAAASVQQVEAHGRGVGAGIAAGIIGLGILGAAANARGRYDYDEDYDGDGGCYRGERHCEWQNRRCYENDYGDTVCRGGDYVCHRPLICD